MPTTYIQAKLTVQPTAGQAELVVPEVLRGLNYRFVIIKDGGEECIVQLDAPAATLENIGQDPACTRLSAKQAKSLLASYPPPRIKRLFRIEAPTVNDPAAPLIEQVALNEQGRQIIDTFQTVRSGFYLIDVSIVASPPIT